VVGADQNIYCPPFNEEAVLCIDAAGGTFRKLEGCPIGAAKWGGVAAGPDGKLYCAPYNASTVLVIDPASGSLAHIGGAGSGAAKWQGIAAGPDGKLYCAPYNAPNVLVIDPESESLAWIGDAGQGEAKWNGVTMGPDGKLYCAPYNASSVLIIDPVSTSLAHIDLNPTASSSAVRSHVREPWSGAQSNASSTPRPNDREGGSATAENDLSEACGAEVPTLPDRKSEGSSNGSSPGSISSRNAPCLLAATGTGNVAI
jgi:streptogramin lyase